MHSMYSMHPMHTLAILAAIPVILLTCSLSVVDSRLTGRLMTVLTWAQVAVVAALMFPLLHHDCTLLMISPGLSLNRVSACFLLLTNIVIAGATTQAAFFFEREQQLDAEVEPQHIKLLYAASAILLLDMSLVFMCNNLGFLWITVESSTLFSAPLVYFQRTKNALEATWKYLIICSVAIAFALLGTIFIFASSQHGAGTTGSLNLSVLTAEAPRLHYALLRLGFIFCLLGYGTKAGIFPLHSWLPDAHSQAPAPYSAVLSGALLNVALYAVWKVVQVVLASGHTNLVYLMAGGLGTITIVAASLFLIRQKDFKRLWAYSSMENTGIMMVAIGLGSASLFLLQAVNHSLAKTAAFLLAGNITQAAGTKNLHGIRGVMRAAPLWAVLLTLTTFAVTGAPPFGAFLSETAILVSAADTQHWISAIVLVLAITLCFIAVCLHVGRVIFGTPTKRFVPYRPLSTSVVPAILILGCLILGVSFNCAFRRFMQ